eukprot:712959-Prymnesium_polylepis.3
MPRPKLYDDFVQKGERSTTSKKRGHNECVVYSIFQCPLCQLTVEVPSKTVATDKASRCGKHLLDYHPSDHRATKLRKTSTRDAEDVEEAFESGTKRHVATTGSMVTIYKLVYIPEERAVYTGRTKDPERRM